MAQDDYYYEIQLTNKQLVFYFMAGATGLVLSFLAGVMVGRGVDQNAGEVLAARNPPREERIVTEESARLGATVAPVEDLTYSRRLESESPDTTLGTTRTAPSVTTAPAPAATAPPVVTQAPAATLPPASAKRGDSAPAVKASPAPAKSTPAPAAPVKSAAADSSSFTIQVGAFKDKGAAESVVTKLKGKGFAAFVVSPGGGLYNVRVGAFESRGAAEKVQAKLRDDEKYQPFIVKP